MPAAYTEASYENSVIELFESMGYAHIYGPDVERDYESPVYDEELIASLQRINPKLPQDALDDAYSKDMGKGRARRAASCSIRQAR